MDKPGYRKIKRPKTSLRRWLYLRGEEDHGTSLFFFVKIGRHRSDNAPEKRKEIFRKAHRQLNTYHDLVDSGEIPKVTEYVPLDLSKSSDRAYKRVQEKREALRYLEEHGIVL